MDKTEAIVAFLKQCPQVAENPSFFNFADAKNNYKQFVMNANDKSLNRTYIDGSVLRRFTVTLIDYKSVAYRALVENKTDENMEKYIQVQDIIDWVTEQAEERNFPDFGEDCIIEEMKVLTEQPSLNGIDRNINPPLAKYSMAIQIDYIDSSKVIYK